MLVQSLLGKRVSIGERSDGGISRTSTEDGPGQPWWPNKHLGNIDPEEAQHFGGSGSGPQLKAPLLLGRDGFKPPRSQAFDFLRNAVLDRIWRVQRFGENSVLRLHLGPCS